MKLKFKSIIEKYKIFVLIIFQLPITLRASQKIIAVSEFDFIEYENLIQSFSLFVFLLLSAKGLAYLFKLKINYSFSYVIFFLLIFFAANVLSLLNIETNFMFFIIVILLICNFSFFANEKDNKIKALQFLSFFPLIYINMNLNYLNKFAYSNLRGEQSGDVDLLILPNVEKIFNSNILNVFQNPVADSGFFHINFTIFGNFYFATLSKTMNLIHDYFTINFLPYTLFFLFLLFIYELKINNSTKLLICLFHISILIINPWIRYLLQNSYMTEGVASLFFIIIFYNMFFQKTITNMSQNIIYLAISYFIFSKLFISLFIFPYLIFMKKNTIFQKTLLLIGPLNILYFMFIKFPPIDANNLINDFNNLILVDILRYWIEDRIWMYSVAFAFLFCFIQILLFNKIDSFNLYILGFNFLNVLMIFLLYSISWTEGVEFESSYRYMLQNYYLNLLLLFTVLGRDTSKN